MTTTAPTPVCSPRPFTVQEQVMGAALTLYVILTTTTDFGVCWYRDVLGHAFLPYLLVVFAVLSFGISAWLLTRLNAMARQRIAFPLRALCVLGSFVGLAGVTYALQHMTPGLAYRDPATGIAAWSWSALLGLMLAVCLVMADLLVVTFLLSKDLVDDIAVERLERARKTTLQLSQDLVAYLGVHGLPPTLANRKPKEQLLELASRIGWIWAPLQEKSLFFIASRQRADGAAAKHILKALHRWCIRPQPTTAGDIAWCIEHLAHGMRHDVLDDAIAAITARFPEVTCASSTTGNISWTHLSAVLAILTTYLIPVRLILHELNDLLAKVLR